MFNQTWKKYLPVITILLKRAATSEQLLKLDPADFERAAGGRKIKFSFSNLQLNHGRSHTSSKHTEMAKELALILQADDQIKILLKDQDYEFAMSTNFQLSIKNNSAPIEALIDSPVGEV